MAEDIFYCPNCGGVMEFDVSSQKLKCPNCSHIVDIANHREDIIEHGLTRRAMQTIRAEEKSSTTLECKGCGAQMEVEAYSTAVSCPYCGSSYVLADKQAEIIVPDGLLPFKLDKNNAKEIVGRWLKKRYLAPGELKNLYQRGELHGMYIPYWTFDAEARAQYSGMGGRNRTEQYRDREGRTHTRTVTDWYPVSGRLKTFFDDVLVCATSHHNRSLLNGIDEYDTKQLVSYAPDYLSGYGAQTFNVNLDTAHDMAVREMQTRLRELARRDILRRYDEAKNITVSADFSSETYKHILLPVYAATYHYKDKVYNILINGRNGKIKGEYPKSFLKIALIIVAVAAVMIGIIYASAKEDDRYSSNDGRQYVCCEDVQTSDYNLEEVE